MRGGVPSHLVWSLLHGGMCSEQHVRWAKYCRMMQDLALGICAGKASMSFGFPAHEGFFGLFWPVRIVHPFEYERSQCS